MIDDPNAIDAVLLEHATPELQKQFVEMLKGLKDSHELQKTHLCWFFIPSPAEYERMRKYAEAPGYDKCPKCGKGRLVVEIYRGNIGDSWNLKCRWGKDGCDFKEYVSDPE